VIAIRTASRFLSEEPEVIIENVFDRPYENAVATARTCYSSRGIITPGQVSGDDLTDPLQREKRAALRDAIALSTYKAGHHTTLQHAHVQFRLTNISRQLIWSFLHSHPFYNSEQVSQRYVEVKPGSVIVPPLSGEALEVYEAAVRAQHEAYLRLCELLQPVVSEAYFRVFSARRGQEKYLGDVKKKAQEVARYVLPIGTFAYMYHTVSVVTLLRYHRLCEQYDAPEESRLVVGKMVARLLEHDPQLAKIIEAPVDLEENPEHALLQLTDASASRTFIDEFDRSLGGRTSKLIDWKARNEEVLAESVREVFGLTRDRLGDDEAIARVLDPARNPLLGNALNLSTHSKLMRTMAHVGYTFRKKMSHAGDSQDQRHRTIPASRPCLQAHLGDEPDYVEPGLIAANEEVRGFYAETMERTWRSLSRLRALGVPAEFRLYLLPNAVSVRFTESADLLNLRHKMAMRLCYNAQEEIWKASVEEASQIREVNPRIGNLLLPPCSLRFLAGERPICPEGPRYCGVPVWRLDLPEYVRVL
jgi:thymidylate synthase ThyX